MSLYAASVPPALQALERAGALLQRPDVGPKELAARLAPDMFDCASQLRSIAIFALRCTWPLTGRDYEPRNFDAGAYGLRARIGHATGQIGLLTLYRTKHSFCRFVGMESICWMRLAHEAGYRMLERSGLLGKVVPCPLKRVAFDVNQRCRFNLMF